jgi:MFS transporter, putative metabolite:H+ symporter
MQIGQLRLDGHVLFSKTEAAEVCQNQESRNLRAVPALMQMSSNAPQSVNRVSIARSLDNASISRGHILIIIVVGLGLFFDIFDVFLAGVLSSVLSHSFGLSQAVLPIVLSSSFLGMFIGASLMGIVADRIGRRSGFLLNLGIYSLFTFAGGFSPNAMVLIVTRLLAGVGIGSQLTLSDVYLSELLPARARGKLMCLAYTISFCGIPAVGLGARLLAPIHFGGIEGWRWLFISGAMGGVVVWALQRYVVESPRWLERTGRNEDACRSAALLLDLPVGSFQSCPPSMSARQKPMPSYLTIFAPGQRQRTLMLYVFQIFQAVGYYSFGTMVPLVLAHRGFSIPSSLTYTTIAFLGYPVGSALSLLIVEKIDRRLLVMTSAFSMATFGMALGFAQSPYSIGALGILYTLVSNIFSNAFHILQAEIFPTAIRGRAAGSAYGLSRLSSAAMPFILLPVLNQFGSAPMFAIVAASMAIVIADIGLFAPRTTGRQLDEIAADI